MADPARPISIASEHLRATIDPMGAQLSSLQDGVGRDLQWNGDPAVWKGRAPILFPIIGELVGGQYRLGDKTYRMSRHGFARDRMFEVVQTTPVMARLRLRWDQQTLALYPFQFELELAFVVQDMALTLTATIVNAGTFPMPASFGFHPALRWPLPFGETRADHVIRFEHEESAPVRRLDDKGLLRDGSFPTPVEGRTLHLRDSLFVDDALIFDRLQSQRLWYGAPTGPQIRIEFPDTPYLALWNKPGASFICIEPWHGHADDEGYRGDFRNKPGSFIVPPGATKKCTMTVALADGLPS
jgi:galactose mutarotase-like enzyme